MRKQIRKITHFNKINEYSQIILTYISSDFFLHLSHIHTINKYVSSNKLD